MAKTSREILNEANKILLYTEKEPRTKRSWMNTIGGIGTLRLSIYDLVELQTLQKATKAVEEKAKILAEVARSDEQKITGNRKNINTLRNVTQEIVRRVGSNNKRLQLDETADLMYREISEYYHGSLEFLYGVASMRHGKMSPRSWI